MAFSTDIRVIDAQAYFRTERTKHGLAFGRQQPDDMTLCHVGVRVETRSGRQGFGWGAVFLSHGWAMPHVALSEESRDRLMRSLVEVFCQTARDHREFHHPLRLFTDLMPVWRQQGRLVAKAFQIENVPHLAELVCASPLDAAIHDGFGNANEIPTYLGYGPDWCSDDLGTIDEGLRGRYVEDYLRIPGRRALVVAHTVGLRDPLSATSLDGSLTPPLSQWIEQESVHCFKVKLGQGLSWDLERLADVHKVAMATLPAVRRRLVSLSADFNGQAPSPEYVVELLDKLRESDADAFDALDYIEQPTSPQEALPDVTAIDRLKPVVLDESFTDVGPLRDAKSLGWSGVALKTCKCQSMSLIANAKATQLGMRCTVQDLSNPGIALLQSAALTSHLARDTSIEANGRQYYPGSSVAEARVHPDLFHPKDGTIVTDSLTGPGLGYRVSEIDRDLFQAAQSALQT